MHLLKAFEAFKLHRRRFVGTAGGLALVAASQSGLGAASGEPNKMDVLQVKSRMRKESGAMSFVNVGRENSTSIELYTRITAPVAGRSHPWLAIEWRRMESRPPHYWPPAIA